jgi:hypothetical protein
LKRRHPVDLDQHFRIMISALTDNGRVTLMNREAEISQANSASPIKVRSVQHRASASNYFGLHLPEVEDFARANNPGMGSAPLRGG